MEKENPEGEYIQLDFFEFLPGYAGGRSLYKQRGPEHFRQLGYLSAGRTEEERKEAAQRGAVTRLRRLYTVPRTEVYQAHGMRLVERVVPWFPHWATRRRKRPIYVRIEISFEQVEKPEGEIRESDGIR
jgi:hypothetical protein